MKKEAGQLLFGIVIGALLMLFLVNFVSNNFFGNMTSQNTCAAMHGYSTYFHHTGFVISLVVLIVFGVLAYSSLISNKVNAK